MACGVDRLTHGRNIAGHTGRRLVVDYTDSLKLMIGILFKTRFDHVGLYAVSPAFIARQT